MTAKLHLDIGTITSITAFDHDKVDVFNSAHGSNAPITCFIAFSCIDDRFLSITRTFEQEIDFASREFGPISFTAGLFYLNQHSATVFYVQPQLVPPQGIAAIDLNTRAKSYAGYGEVTWKLTDRLSVIGGLRYSKEDDNDSPLPTLPNIKHSEDAFTPRAVIKYDVSNALNIYASYSQGYKAGLSGASNTGSTPSFQPVDPERINAFEVGTKYSSRNISFNLAGWYYHYTNKQESIYQGTVPIEQNTGPVRLYGVDFDTSLRLSHDFSVQGNATWIPVAKFLDFPNAAGYSYVQDATGAFLPGIGYVVAACPAGAPAQCISTGSFSFDATGMRIPRAPRFSGNLTLAYNHDTGAGTFDASATVSYSTKISEAVNAAVVQPAYATVAAQAGYRFGESGLRLSVYGQNLTNHVIIQGSISSASGHLQTLAAPRELGVRVEYSF